MLKDIERVLVSEQELKEITERLGKQISEDYKDKNLLLVSVLKGSVAFMADLMRNITVPCKIDFMALSTYGSGTESSGRIRVQILTLAAFLVISILLITYSSVLPLSRISSTISMSYPSG